MQTKEDHEDPTQNLTDQAVSNSSSSTSKKKKHKSTAEASDVPPSSSTTTTTTTKPLHRHRRRLQGRHVVLFVFLTAILVTISFNIVMFDDSTQIIPDINVQDLASILEHVTTTASSAIAAAATDDATSPTSHHDHDHPNTTLALLYPPGLLGGYRNQVIRFMALVAYAVQHNLSNLFLPSLLWSTQLNSTSASDEWYPVLMQDIFDVEHWNSFNNLPRLVQHLDHSDCWNQQPKWPDDEIHSSNNNKSTTMTLNHLQRTALQQGSLDAISNQTYAMITNTLKVRPRKLDLLPNVQHCQHPVVYGGGKNAGRLWNDYLTYRNNRAANRTLPHQVDQTVLQALQPAKPWRDVARQCIQQHTRQQYMALHARVELEMMAHNCGKDMNWNLTHILQDVTAFLRDNNNNEQYSNVSGLFVAVSRSGMRPSSDSQLYQRFQPYADENFATLNRLVGTSSTEGEPLVVSQNNKLKVFECGKNMMDAHYNAQHAPIKDYGTLLEQAINFYIAVNAQAFVGVHGSSYSTDIWLTRYALGLGRHNYQYTKTRGIQPVPNGGRPEYHGNCKRKKSNQKPKK